MSKKGANFSLHSGSWKASAWWGVANRGRGDQGRSVDWNLGISTAGMTFLASDGWSSFQNIIFLAVFHFRWFGGVVSVHLLWSLVTHTALGLGIWREKTWGWVCCRVRSAGRGGRRMQDGPCLVHITSSAEVGTGSQVPPHVFPSALTHFILPLKGLGGELDPSHLTLKRLVHPNWHLSDNILHSLWLFYS